MNMKEHNYNQPLPPNKYNPLSWISPEAVIGENVWIGAFVYIGANVEIGNNVSISNGVQIFDHDNSWHRISEGGIKKKRSNVVIGDFTQIGANSVIVAGSYPDLLIGDHCIIGALSLVKTSVPSYSIAVGNPCKIIKHIDEAAIQEKAARL